MDTSKLWCHFWDTYLNPNFVTILVMLPNYFNEPFQIHEIAPLLEPSTDARVKFSYKSINKFYILHFIVNKFFSQKFHFFALSH